MLMTVTVKFTMHKVLVLLIDWDFIVPFDRAALPWSRLAAAAIHTAGQHAAMHAANQHCC
jgi:hypothetical protein